MSEDQNRGRRRPYDDEEPSCSRRRTPEQEPVRTFFKFPRTESII